MKPKRLRASAGLASTDEAKMELDITEWVEKFGDEPEQFSDSIANSGLQSIGKINWQNAIKAASEVMLVTDENRDELIEHFAGYGAWTRDELNANTDAELNALLIQFIAGDYKERRDAEERDELAKYEENQGGRLFKGDIEGSDGFGRWFYYVGM